MPSPDAADALSALAPLLRVHPELQTLCRFGAAWASPHGREETGWVPFHLVLTGSCFLDIAGRKPVPLSAGDIVLLPRGDSHVVRSSVFEEGKPRPPVVIRPHGAVGLASNTDQPETELICGRLAFEQAQASLASAALPPLVVLTVAEDPAVGRLKTLMTTIRDELDAALPGVRAVCTDLASALFVMALRLHFCRAVAETGFLRLLAERQTARAVLAMIEEPARDWSLDDLADRAGTSRATLVRDFRRLADTAPLGLLTDLRLDLARRAVVQTDRGLADIALDVGYRSQSALSRAFQRRFGAAPSEMRRDAGRVTA